MTEQEIVICTKCKGKGKLYYDVLVDYHKREYETEIEICSHCDGKGRLLKCTTITYKKLENK